MDSVTKYQRLAFLIFKEQNGTLSNEEISELREWIQCDVKNQLKYERLKKRDFSKDLERYQHIDVSAGLKKYKHRYALSSKNWQWSVAAAVVALILTVSTLFFTFNGDKKELFVQQIVPGSSTAVLILSDGRTIDLTDKNQQNIIITAGASVINSGSEINYTTSNEIKQTEAEVYNELIIPKGGEYILTMADGTRVWINSQTKLKYPVNFNGSERKVYLEGEAYFEVKKDEKRPFYVVMKHHVSVEVLGTSFNVRAYPDEETIETVLEKGSVRMHAVNDCIVLTPGNMSSHNNATGQMKLSTVETELYTVWRHGQFVFNEETVENILTKLSRWYDMEVFYQDESVRQIVFSGSVRKYDQINTLLKAMEIAGGVKFEIKGHTLVVRRCN